MKIGILGGTFNPIHSGHIAMAEYVVENLGMDKICFLPNGQPPHKKDYKIADKHHRLEMVKLAIQDNHKFYVSDYEIMQDKHCYTVDTIKYFHSLSNDDYFFIIGADSLFQLSTWKNADELKKICSFIVCDRARQGDTDAEVERLRQQGCNIMLCDMPLVNITSTDIRRMVKEGISISGYTDEKVAQYIYKNKLYL